LEEPTKAEDPINVAYGISNVIGLALIIIGILMDFSGYEWFGIALVMFGLSQCLVTFLSVAKLWVPVFMVTLGSLLIIIFCLLAEWRVLT